MLLEPCDRKARFEQFIETREHAGLQYPSVSKTSVRHRYFLSETIADAHLSELDCDGLGFFECVFAGGIWQQIQFGSSEWVNTTLRNLYLEKVDFAACTVRGLRFEHCVLVDCVLPPDCVLAACLVRTAPAAPVVAAPPSPRPPDSPAPSVPGASGSAEPSRIADRFAELER